MEYLTSDSLSGSLFLDNSAFTKKAFFLQKVPNFSVHNVYEPDVLYLTPDTVCRLEEKRIVGAPDLVVEVLSPSTAKYDRQEKYEAYQQYGVNEYWIVDPVHEVVEVWQLEIKRFKRMGAFANNDVFESRPLAVIVNVKDIFTA